MAGNHYDGPSVRSPAIVSPRHVRSRTQSISSDRPSSIGRNLLAPPQSVSPEAAFIAASAASQIVTNDHDSHADVWYDEPGMIPAGETALVSDGALRLVNNFLDQLLFNFLQIAKSTTLSALRPAVTEVLKPKLARDAITNADEELREYLGGADEEDYVKPQNGDPSRDWDLELVWKRTRLRSMVYSSLGDMEEEDEDMYMEQEHLEIGADEQISDVISPAVAIFLTSVLEYMGELTLTVAGQAAYHRVRAEFEKEIKDGLKTPSDIADRIVVEESDMERVALDRTLGRLWRGWKKRIRAPAVIEFGNRPFSRTSIDHTRNGSDVNPLRSPGSEMGIESKPSQEQVEEGVKEEAQPPPEPADIPLPVGDNDVEEIEVPGYAVHSDDEEDEEDVELAIRRPRSLVFSSPRNPTLNWLDLPLCLDLGQSDFLCAGHAPRRSLKSSRKQSQMKNRLLRKKKQKEMKRVLRMWSKWSLLSCRPLLLCKQRTKRAPFQHQFLTRTRMLKIFLPPDSSLVTEEICSARITDVAGSASPHEFQAVPLEAADPVHINSPSPTDYPSPQSDLTHQPDSAYNHAPVSPLETGRSDPFVATKSATTSTQRQEKEYSMPADKPYEIGAATSTHGQVATESSPRSSARAPTMQPSRGSSLPRQPLTTSGTKVSILSSSHSSNHFINEPIPEVPSRATGHSGRQGSKSNSIGQASMERTRTRESDDGVSLPVQSNGHHRSTHTSGSSGSSAAGRHKAFRTSEEQVPSRADSVARNFEELIHSNQTITYTLTPEHMRNMDPNRSSEMPRSASLVNEGKGGSSQRVIGISADSRTQKPTPISIPGTSAASTPKSSSVKSPLRTGASAGSSQPMSPATMTPKSPRMPASLAREARVPGDSTADFAEFIKSTGPAGGDARASPARGSNGVFPGQVAAAAPFPVTSSPSRGNEARRVSSASNRNRYQPREASVDGNGDNSDLIDFIRQGPPGPGGNNRIPRHVAPFSSTATPDHTAIASGGRAGEHGITEVRHSQASTNATENSGPSFHSSVNSNTALLKNNKPQPPPKMFDDDGMPKRTRRRVRDPYAIDFSDEDDDLDELVTPKPPPKKEESLADFLRNYEPPQSPWPHRSPKSCPRRRPALQA
uniref:Flo11 n=1 Tax=Bionectria ochroleuca TaxID=29856 RepID=A0A8H7KAQ4_BIOOC